MTHWGLEADAMENRLLEAVRTRAGDGQACVLFSAGLDSSLLLAACVRAGLPTLALMAVGPAYARADLDEGQAFCESLGVQLILFEAHEDEVPEFRANTGDRCYHCKKAIATRALEVARNHCAEPVLMHGAQLDDLEDYRPGMKAAAEMGLAAPLLDAGMGKEAIRALARQWGLSTAEKAPSPCLASRIPIGTEATPERMEQVQKVESVLRNQGLWPARARHHGAVVRLELPMHLMPRVLEEPLRQQLRQTCLDAGFRFVSVDLGGLQSGSIGRPEA